MKILGLSVIILFILVISGKECASLTLMASEPVLSGIEVNLTCSSNFAMPFAIKWYRGDTYIGEEDFVHADFIDFYSAIIVQNLLTYRLKIFTCDYGRDNTIWSCEVIGSREYLDLHVKVPVSTVTFEVNPSNTAVVSGAILTFTCTTNSINPQATVSWYVGDVLVQGGTTSHNGPDLVVTVGTLIYTTTDSDRNVQVYCTARNVDIDIRSATSTTMDVKIPVRSLTLSVPGQSGSMVTVNAGDQLIFSCVTGDIYPAASIVWFISGSEHIAGTGISDSNTDPIVTTGTLRYTTSSADNNEEVHCTALSIGSTFTSNNITMDVRYAPTNLPSIIDLSSPRFDGVQTTVTCTSIGGNPLGSLTMTCGAAGEQGLLSDDGTSVTYVLTLTPTPALDGATCTCTRTGTIGAISSDVGAITVHYAPTNLPSIIDLSSPRFDGVQTTVTCTSIGGNPLGSLTMTCGAAGEQGLLSDDGTSVTYVLTLTPTPALDGATCSCTRTGTIGAISSDVGAITVHYAPTNLPSIIDLSSPRFDGVQTTVTCTSIGGNPLGYLTMTCGAAGEQGLLSDDGTSVTYVLTLTPTPAVDGATCTCTRTGTIGAISSDVGAITVHYSPPNGPVMSGVVTTGHLYENYPTIVTCTSQGGNPLGDLTLSCPNAGTTGSSSVGAVTTATLNIASVPRSLNGLACTCDRTNAYETPDTNRVSVIASVYYPPSAPSISQPGPWLENSAQTLTCVVAVPGNPLTHFQWIKGPTIMGNNAVHQFPSVDKSENGATFTCTIENDFTVDKQQPVDPAFVILNVQYGPSVSTSGDEFTFTEGDPATVITTIDANPPAIQFAWIKSGETTASSNDQDLNFNIISRQHAGMYKLFATNYPNAVGSAGMTGNVVITIVVNYSPDVTVSVTDSEVNETVGSVQFTCRAYGVPDSYTFLSWKHYIHGTWIRDIPEDTPNTRNGVSTLTLHQLSFEMTGRYVCTVHNTITNAQGQLNQMNGADVTVLGTAQFQSMKNISAELGSKVTLSIKLYSNLTVNSFKWTATENSIVGDNYKINLINNTEVTLPFYGTDIILDGTEAQLLIQTMGAKDVGTYMLTVVNDIGASSYSLIISAAGPPETPRNFEELSVHTDNVTVSWLSGFNGGYTQEFHLSHKAGSSQEYSDDVVHPDNGHGNIIKVTIQNLNPGKAYTLRVRAVSVRPNDNVSGYAYITINTPTETDPGKGIIENSNAGAIAGGIVGVIAVLGTLTVVLIIYFDRSGLISCCQNITVSSKGSAKTDDTIYENEVFTRAETENEDANAYEELSEHEVRRSDAGYIHANIESVNGNTDARQQINSTYRDLDQKTDNEHEYSKLKLSRGRTTGLDDHGYIDVHQMTRDDIQYSEKYDTPYINMN